MWLIKEYLEKNRLIFDEVMNT